jgi:hypothetical protein
LAPIEFQYFFLIAISKLELSLNILLTVMAITVNLLIASLFHPIVLILFALSFTLAGDYIHSWLAATQYISPLMANFDPSLSNDSYVKYCEDGE